MEPPSRRNRLAGAPGPGTAGVPRLPGAGLRNTGLRAAPYGAAPYGAPGYPPPAQPGTNGFAIAALIFGIIGGALLGVIFGFVALSQIKKSGQGGRGLAIAGLVFSGLWVLVVAGAVAAAVATSANRNDSGQITAGGSLSATSLTTGDCLNDLQNTTSLLSLPAVPCAQPHQGEVFAVFDLPAGPYPGPAAVHDQVGSECNTRLGRYSPSAAGDAGVGLFTIYPLEQNWTAGDRQVVCVATAVSGSATGSIRGH